MSQPFPTERVFDADEIGYQLGPLDPGLLLLHRGRTAMGCCDLGHRALPNVPRNEPGGVPSPLAASQHLAHLALPGEEPVAQALAAVADHRTLAVTMHAGGDANPARLAVAFGEHLAAHRRRHDRSPVAPCITAATAPDLPDPLGLVRVPHLLTIRHTAGWLADTAVWEVMTRQQAIRWLGGPLPGLEAFEKALAQLLALRRRARAGELPATPDGEQLRRLLVDRYLSIRLIYRHPQLFSALLSTVAEHPTDPSGAQ